MGWKGPKLDLPQATVAAPIEMNFELKKAKVILFNELFFSLLNKLAYNITICFCFPE